MGFADEYATKLGLLKGVWAGGHGFEALGYSLIDVNFFAQHSLQLVQHSPSHQNVT